MHCTFWFCFSILLTAQSTAPTNKNRLPSPKIIHSSLLSSLDSCNNVFVALQAHCRQVMHCFRNVNPWWSIILILSCDISFNPGPSVRNIKAYLLNGQSLHNKTSAFSNFVLLNDLDIIGVMETWLRPSETQGLMNEITPAGFQLHHVPGRNKKCGGVAVFVRNDIDSMLCQTDQLDTFEHIILGDVNIQLDSQNCWTDNFNTVLSDFDFIQHVSTHKRTYP